MKLTATAAALLVGGTMAFAQGAESQTITVPLLDDDVAFRVPVKMFGRTNYFLVDTGTSATALDGRYRDRLGSLIRRWDGHDFYRSPEIALGNTRLAVDEVFCTDLKMFRLITGEPCDGILGMEFLKNHVIELDFNRGVVGIGKEVPAQVRSNAWRIPMKLSNARHFRVPTLINGKLKMDLLLDTGDSSTISLKKEDWDLVFPPDEKTLVRKVLLAGLNKKVTESVLARLASVEVEVEAHKYSNLVCVLSLYDTSPSALGIGFFRRHHVVFDFPNQMLYLQPGKQFDIQEEHDMSGLHLLRVEGKTLVHSVDEGSPASQAGIQAGDFILYIDGQRCAELAMKTIRQALRKNADKKVLLRIERAEKTMEMSLLLRRLI